MLHVRVFVHVNLCASVFVRLKSGCFLLLFFFLLCMYFCTKSTKKKKKSRLHILAHVGCIAGRNRTNEEVDGNAQRYIMYAVSTNHRFLYKPSNHQLLSYHIRLQQSLWILHNYHIFSLLPGIHNSYCIFFF